ncbi:MAG: division plane positioning ATPase MipZ [bacterium]
MSLRLSFINEKGGTAKTALAVHAAAHLARLGKKTALLDLAQARGRTVFEISPQCPSSRSMQAVFAEIFSAPEPGPPETGLLAGGLTQFAE